MNINMSTPTPPEQPKPVQLPFRYLLHRKGGGTALLTNFHPHNETQGFFIQFDHFESEVKPGWIPFTEVGLIEPLTEEQYYGGAQANTNTQG